MRLSECFINGKFLCKYILKYYLCSNSWYVISNCIGNVIFNYEG